MSYSHWQRKGLYDGARLRIVEITLAMGRRHTPMFRIWVTLGLLFSLWSTLASPGVCSQYVNGAAGMYIRLPAGAVSTLTANLALPLKRNNKSSYATWIMLVANGDRTKSTFVQCGLLRWSKRDYKVVPFISYHRRGSASWGFTRFRDIITTGNASSSIALENGMVILSVGGKTYWRRRLIDLFDVRDSLYYEVADEVTAYGDSLSGIISGLKVSVDGRQSAVMPRCGSADSGLSMRQISVETWDGRGVFTKGAGRYFLLPSGAVVSSCRSQS
jgi:hypothetical protein